MGYKIASFNIQKFSRLSVLGRDSKKDIDMMATIIRENEIDIIAIQEILHKEALRELLEKISLQYVENDRLIKNYEKESYRKSNLTSESYHYRTKHWEGYWAKPISKYGNNIDEGYAFIWKRDRVRLSTDTKGNPFEPRISDYSESNKLVRPPLIGRFTPINSRYEFRLINTHIVYSVPSKMIDEFEDAGDEYTKTTADDYNLRRSEFDTLVKNVYVKYAESVFDVTGHDRNPRNIVPYTFLMGDYNLNLSMDDSSGATLGPDRNPVNVVSRGAFNIVTVIDKKTTLKGKPRSEEKQRELRCNPDAEIHLSNNYDHFSYDTNMLAEHNIADPNTGVIYAFDKYAGNAEESVYEIYRYKISDHLPIYMEFDVRKKRGF